MTRSILLLTGVLTLAGCNMAPTYVRPAAPVPAALPTGDAYAPAQAGAAGLPWTQLVGDAKLQAVIAGALTNNRDLRATLANVQAARAQYRIQRASQLPTVTGDASAAFVRQNDTRQNSYSADIGFGAFEIDLFGRLRNLSESALQSYLATEEGARAARIALIAETATVYATLAADQELLAVSRQTLASAQRTLDLVSSLNGAGLTGKLDVYQAQTTVEQAASDVAANVTQVAQDRNAIDLLTGAPSRNRCSRLARQPDRGYRQSAHRADLGHPAPAPRCAAGRTSAHGRERGYRRGARSDVSADQPDLGDRRRQFGSLLAVYRRCLCLVGRPLGQPADLRRPRARQYRL